ncbi:MAG: hypothetical protein AB1546_00565 [bacterium]
MMTNIDEVFRSLKERFCPELTDGWFSTIHFIFTDDGEWTFDVNSGELQITQGLTGEPLSVVKTDVNTFDRVFSGELPLEIPMMADRFDVDNLVEIFKLQTIFKKRR